jgi:hypothetical protein
MLESGMFRKLGFVTLSAMLALGAGQANAQVFTGINDAMPVAIDLPGNTKYDGWYNLSNATKSRKVHGTTYSAMAGLSGYPMTFASDGEWGSPIASQLQSNSGQRAQVNRILNRDGLGYANGMNAFNADGSVKDDQTWSSSDLGPTPATDGLYSLAFDNEPNSLGGKLGVFEANPLAALKTVVFQLEIGGANEYDLVGNLLTGLNVGPLDSFSGNISLTLTLQDNTQQTLSAHYVSLITQGQTDERDLPIGPGGELVTSPIYANLYGFQWDLSSYTNIASFYISFEMVEHSTVFAMQLNQSDVFAQVIPEPSTWAMAASGLAMMAIYGSRRRRAKV